VVKFTKLLRQAEETRPSTLTHGINEEFCNEPRAGAFYLLFFFFTILILPSTVKWRCFCGGNIRAWLLSVLANLLHAWDMHAQARGIWSVQHGTQQVPYNLLILVEHVLFICSLLTKNISVLVWKKICLWMKKANILVIHYESTTHPGLMIAIALWYRQKKKSFLLLQRVGLLCNKLYTAKTASWWTVDKLSPGE
jgi:hypothetical protein